MRVRSPMDAEAFAQGRQYDVSNRVFVPGFDTESSVGWNFKARTQFLRRLLV